MANLNTAVATLPELSPEETALLAGDLSKLSAEQRANLITSVCRSLGLNPLTQPFSYITLNGKLTLYTRKDATDQLRKLHQVSVISTEHELLSDVLFITVKVQDRSGRIDQDMGAVSVAGLRGDGLANAYMKALTKGKRRATLSICGLGMLDETEVDTIPNATRVEEVRPAAARLPAHTVNVETGEVLDAPPAVDIELLRSLCISVATALHNRGVEAPEFPADDSTAADILRIVNAHVATNVALLDRETTEAIITAPGPTSKLGKRLHNLESVNGIRLTVPALTPTSASWLLAILGGVLTPAQEPVEV